MVSHDVPPTLGLHVPLREATACGEGPKYLIRDNDRKFEVNFARVAKTSRVEMLTTPDHPITLGERMPSASAFS